MRVKITDSFCEAGATAVQRGCVMEVPELIAALWIRIHRAVAFPDPNARPATIADERPTRRPAALEMPGARQKARR
jgi:hypothetical protein